MQQSGSAIPLIQIVLPEVLDERVDFSELFPEQHRMLQIDCHKVKRINSVGVRGLTGALNRVRRTGAKLVFSGVTPPLVEAIEFVSNLLPPKSQIESVYVPYYCHSCKNYFQILYMLSEIAAKQAALEIVPCSKCGKNAELDHLPELYFKNLVRISGKNI